MEINREEQHILDRIQNLEEQLDILNILHKLKNRLFVIRYGDTRDTNQKGLENPVYEVSPPWGLEDRLDKVSRESAIRQA